MLWFAHLDEEDGPVCLPWIWRRKYAADCGNCQTGTNGDAIYAGKHWDAVGDPECVYRKQDGIWMQNGDYVIITGGHTCQASAGWDCESESWLPGTAVVIENGGTIWKYGLSNGINCCSEEPPYGFPDMIMPGEYPQPNPLWLNLPTMTCQVAATFSVVTFDPCPEGGGQCTWSSVLTGTGGAAWDCDYLTQDIAAGFQLCDETCPCPSPITVFATTPCP